jgi:methyl coenzyme M reductase subunit C-like uncharacterized protein (methanogenesis marker protein 7)
MHSPSLGAKHMQHSQSDIVELVSRLVDGNGVYIGLAAGLAVWILLNVVYKRITGHEFVKPRRERREALKRRKVVLFEYERDR